jgi:hypothetical protein
MPSLYTTPAAAIKKKGKSFKINKIYLLFGTMKYIAMLH